MKHTKQRFKKYYLEDLSYWKLFTRKDALQAAHNRFYCTTDAYYGVVYQGLACYRVLLNEENYVTKRKTRTKKT